MNWTALAAIGAGGVIVAIGVVNNAATICQLITGKPCPALPGTTTSSSSTSTTNPGTPGNAKSCPPGFTLENGYCVPMGPTNNPSYFPFVGSIASDVETVPSSVVTSIRSTGL